VGSFIADGADGGQNARKLGQSKSRRWRDGDSRRDKAVTQLYRVTAWFRSQRGSRLQAASRRAVFSLAGAVAQWRSGGGAGAAAVTEDTKPVRGFMRSGVVQYVMR